MTKHGAEFYKRKCRLFFSAEKEGNLDFYKNFLYNEQQELNKKLSHFLRDDDMTRKYKMNEEDKEGWKMWREMSDEHSVLSYFLKR